MATHSSILAWRTPMDRGARWAVVHGVTESDRIERLSTAQPKKGTLTFPGRGILWSPSPVGHLPFMVQEF